MNILAIGRNPEILATVIRLINNHEGWQGTGAEEDEEAIELFQRHHYDVVLLTNGIEETSEAKLRKLFTHQHPDVIILQHYGGGSGLLENEILEALDAQKGSGNYNFTDNPFHN